MEKIVTMLIHRIRKLMISIVLGKLCMICATNGHGSTGKIVDSTSGSVNPLQSHYYVNRLASK
jgi:hypothetical protein